MIYLKNSEIKGNKYKATSPDKTKRPQQEKQQKHFKPQKR